MSAKTEVITHHSAQFAMLSLVKGEVQTVVDILMHDTGKSKMTTVEALPRIIEAVQAAGYTIEPLTIDSTPIQHNW